MRRHLLITVGASVVSATAASAVMWFVIKKKLEESYEVRLAEELQASIDFLVESKVELEKVTIGDPDFEEEEPVKILPEVLEELSEVEGERIFGDEDKPSLDALAANQKIEYHKILTSENYLDDALDPEEPPYEDPEIQPISRDLFQANVSEFEQHTLTYFADGGVLDEEGGFVSDHEILIGPNPPKFGMMSEDPDIVYIRNKRLEREYEVIRDEQNASDFLSHELHSMYSERS